MKASSWLWLGVGGAFALLLTAWTAMFFFAGRAQVQPVPLVAAAGEGKP